MGVTSLAARPYYDKWLNLSDLIAQEKPNPKQLMKRENVSCLCSLAADADAFNNEPLRLMSMYLSLNW